MYLGGYAREEEAARAYDKAAIKYWGANANLNFPRSDYLKWESEIANTATAQYVAQLRSCLLYTSPSPRDGLLSRMPSSA